MAAESLETQSLFSAAQQSLQQVQKLFTDPGFLRKLEKMLRWQRIINHRLHQGSKSVKVLGLLKVDGSSSNRPADGEFF